MISEGCFELSSWSNDLKGYAGQVLPSCNEQCTYLFTSISAARNSASSALPSSSAI